MIKDKKQAELLETHRKNNKYKYHKIVAYLSPNDKKTLLEIMNAKVVKIKEKEKGKPCIMKI